MQTVFCADGGAHPRPSSSPPRRLRGKRKEERGKSRALKPLVLTFSLSSILFPLTGRPLRPSGAHLLGEFAMTSKVPALGLVAGILVTSSMFVAAEDLPRTGKFEFF